MLSLSVVSTMISRMIPCQRIGRQDAPLSRLSLLPTRAPLLARSPSVALFHSLSLSLVHALSSPFLRVYFWPPRASLVSPRARRGEYEQFKTRLRYSRNTTNTHALRSLAPSHATPHLCLSALLPRHGGAASATGTPCPRHDLSSRDLASRSRSEDARTLKNSAGRRARAATRNSPMILSLRRSPGVARGAR